jgi:hypothetical protein
MAVEITIEVPEALGRQLRPFQERLSEVLERGLREILAERSGDFQDENAIMKLLTSQPRPEQVLAIRPSPELQARVSELLDRNKEGALSRQEEAELERYLMLEHLVRLAKAHAYHQMTSS